MPRITVRGPFGPQFDHRTDREVIRVGRADTNDLVLEDAAVSRVHAELRLERGRWVVEDLGSSNGTFLNGIRLARPARLNARDEIAMGQTVLVFEPGAERVAGAAGRPSCPGRQTEPLATWPSVPGFRRAGLFLAGESGPIRELFATIERVAASEATVLIRGESGTGKELVARLIHACSGRAGSPFVVVNCPALPGSLLESELFGVERGVATGVEPRQGRFETARGGTILLDEIGDMDLGAQAKILRVLEEKAVERIGGRVSIPLDVRVLAATNHDLVADMERAAFRRDLYYRLNTVTVVVPPLRDRREDIPLLVEHFLSGSAGRVKGFSKEAVRVLGGYGFPGNVRELERIVVRAQLLGKGEIAGPEDLPEEVRWYLGGQSPWEGTGDEGTVILDSAETLYRRIVEEGESFWGVVQKPYLRREVSRETVRRLIVRAHREAGGSYKRMAVLLRVGEEYKKFINFLQHHDLKPEK